MARTTTISREDRAAARRELAAQLHIHVNTLRYRLRRAEDALGAPLTDPRLLARLYLAFEETATQPAGRSSRDE